MHSWTKCYAGCQTRKRLLQSYKCKWILLSQVLVFCRADCYVTLLEITFACYLLAVLCLGEFGIVCILLGARGGAVVWGTALGVRRLLVRFPMEPLEFFIHIILLGIDSASNRNEYQGYFLRGEGGRCVGLTTFMCRLSLKPGSLNLLEPSGPVQACTGITSPSCTLLGRWRVRTCFVPA
jgi:hypothetical protein